MADFHSSLPVRTQADGDIASKITDGSTTLDIVTDGGTSPTSAVAVAGQDGANAQVLHLSTAGDAIVVGAAAGGAAVSGNPVRIGGKDGSGNTQDILTDTSGQIETAHDVNTNAIFAKVTDGTDDLQIVVDGAAAGTNGVHMLGTDGTNAQIIATDTSGNLKVVVTDSTAGDQIQSYNTASAVAVDATSTHTYTVTAGKTLLLKTVEAAASGKMKIEVKTGVPASETTKAVAFISTATPTVQIMFPEPIEVAATDNVLVVRTNRDNQAQDVYDFINGEEI